MAGSSSNPGTGARMQLAAVGAQDTFLRGDFSHYTVGFRRAARFATWTDELKMEYTPGKRSSVDIPKSGDLLADMYLEITLPAVPGAGTWCPNVGYTFLRRVRLLLNDQEIHNFERLWYDIYDALHTSEAHAAGLADMVGRAPKSTATSHVLYVPLRMLTCRKGAPRPPFPLQAVPRSSFKLDIEWEVPSVLNAQLTADPGIGVKVMVDYVELDEPERSRMVRPHALLFESVIDSDALSYFVDSGGDIADAPNIRVNLGNVRFPVKALVWVAYQENGPLFTYLQDPLDKVTVTFNGQDRFSARPSEYFQSVQKYQHCARALVGPPAVYSFALHATSRIPSGSADFGALSQASLQAIAAPGTPRFKLKVFSVYYNILEIGGTTGRVVFV